MTDKNNKVIVAVDDSSVVLMTLDKILSEHGFEVKGFSKGMRALKYLKTEVPDLIILDIEMPEINGFEMLEMIKEKEELVNVPVIFLTSNNQHADVVNAIKGGAKEYILKPIKEELLLEKVNSILGIKKEKLSWDNI